MAMGPQPAPNSPHEGHPSPAFSQGQELSIKGMTSKQQKANAHKQSPALGSESRFCPIETPGAEPQDTRMSHIAVLPSPTPSGEAESPLVSATQPSASRAEGPATEATPEAPRAAGSSMRTPTNSSTQSGVLAETQPAPRIPAAESFSPGQHGTASQSRCQQWIAQLDSYINHREGSLEADEKLRLGYLKAVLAMGDELCVVIHGCVILWILDADRCAELLKLPRAVVDSACEALDVVFGGLRSLKNGLLARLVNFPPGLRNGDLHASSVVDVSRFFQRLAGGWNGTIRDHLNKRQIPLRHRELVGVLQLRSQNLRLTFFRWSLLVLGVHNTPGNANVRSTLEAKFREDQDFYMDQSRSKEEYEKHDEKMLVAFEILLGVAKQEQPEAVGSQNSSAAQTPVQAHQPRPLKQPQNQPSEQSRKRRRTQSLEEQQVNFESPQEYKQRQLQLQQQQLQLQHLRALQQQNQPTQPQQPQRVVYPRHTVQAQQQLQQQQLQLQQQRSAPQTQHTIQAQQQLQHSAQLQQQRGTPQTLQHPHQNLHLYQNQGQGHGPVLQSQAQGLQGSQWDPQRRLDQEALLRQQAHLAHEAHLAEQTQNVQQAQWAQRAQQAQQAHQAPHVQQELVTRGRAVLQQRQQGMQIQTHQQTQMQHPYSTQSGLWTPSPTNSAFSPVQAQPGVAQSPSSMSGYAQQSVDQQPQRAAPYQHAQGHLAIPGQHAPAQRQQGSYMNGSFAPNPQSAATLRNGGGSPAPAQSHSNPPPSGQPSQAQGVYHQYIDSLLSGPTRLPTTARRIKFEFDITDGDFKRLPKCQVTSDGRVFWSIFEGCLRVRFRICTRPASGSAEHDPAFPEAEWVGASPVWPSALTIRVNEDGFVDIPRKLRASGAKPCDIAAHLRPGRNVVSVAVVSAAPPNMEFYGAVEMLETGTPSSIMEAVRERWLPEAETIGLIEARLSVDDDDIEVVDPEIYIRVTDPISGSLAGLPCRGEACSHLDIFDLRALLESRRPKRCSHGGLRAACSTCTADPAAWPDVPSADMWTCPICGGDARPGRLVVDTFLQGIIAKLSFDPVRGASCAQAVYVDGNGKWRAKAPGKEKEEEREVVMIDD